ncbi:uncharacterized protein LOC9653169 isoform X2 [Selaginella moellendorffii]|uniref:uncharacterized protein LOC9653169 isoform X2 n=1 Tax=Selaginella moellendorffii TaxID=88036 RepID=UPI000D1C6F9B|nr:uncharacterized protein LOC9653169 isoform X2 [Selaginella moellendorffii]|eukprot:XP_024515228.1 uncharacterized protein LOC9653169 isoform X2 [Selaginella moellendorffii]
MAILLDEEEEEELWWIPVPTAQQGRCRKVCIGGALCSVLNAAVDFHHHLRRDGLFQLASALGADSKSLVPLVTLHNLGSSTSTHGAHTEEKSRPAKPNGFVFSKGLGFAGQVFGLYSSSRSCLVGVEEKRYLKDLPFSCSFVKRFLSKILRVEASKGPAFHFYINHDDAKAYLNRLKVPDMEIGSVPLHLAYKFFKERPSLFSFIPSKKQVDLAKTIIKKEQGGKAAQQFQGVPVFTSHCLSILVVGPSGARWFRPHFFKKEELDGVIRSSMEHHYQSLIRNRRARRHNQVSDFPSDMAEDDLEMLESQDIQDFVEDMDEWSSVLESIMAKAAQMYFQDTLDRAIFGNKWCRMLAGIQPSFPILVDSFERRVTSETENAVVSHHEQKKPHKASGWFDRLGLNLPAQTPEDEEELSTQTPHLTVVAGIAGSSTDQVVKAASSAIQEARDKIERNEMTLENLFIADLGGPHIWSNPSAGLSGLGGGSSDERSEA